MCERGEGRRTPPLKAVPDQMPHLLSLPSAGSSCVDVVSIRSMKELMKEHSPSLLPQPSPFRVHQHLQPQGLGNGVVPPILPVLTPVLVLD